MKKNLNRILALAMAACMTATVVPVTAMAETTEENNIQITSEEEDTPQAENEQAEETTVVEIDSVEDINAAGGSYKVVNEIAAEDNIKITGEVNIDLNGQTIQFASGKGFIVANGGSLTITGSGKITEVVDNEGNLAPVRVFGGGIVEIDGNITLEGWAGIMVRQEGKDGTGKCGNSNIKITVKDATLMGISDGEGANGLYVNGLVDGSDNIISLKNVTIESAGDGIYQAGIVKTTVTGGSVAGENCGIIVAAGEMTIDGTEVAGGSGSGYENNGGATGGAVEVDNTALAVMEHAHIPVTVTVKDGAFEGGAGVTAVGDVDVKLKGGTFTAADEGYGVRITDGADVTIAGAKVKVKDGYGVYVKGDNAEDTSTLTVVDGEIHVDGDGYAIAGNAYHDNTEVTISGGEITCTGGVAIYQPQDGEMTIEGGTVRGTTGVYVKAGSIKIKDNAQIEGTTKAPFQSVNDGAIGTGAAVVVETNIAGGYGVVPEAEITGGKFLSDEGVVTVQSVNTDGGEVTGFVSGGTFSESLLNSNVLDETLTVQLEETVGNAPFSYYKSVAEAKEAVTSSVGGTITGTENGEAVNETVAPVEPTPDSEPTPSKKKSSSKKYDVEIDKNDIENGTVKLSSTKVKKGATVTITVTPDKGYELDELIVLDGDGEELELKDKGNGKYTFTMPRDDVEIEAEFVKAVSAVEKPVEKDAEKTELVLTINQKIVQVNGEYVVNDVAPILKDARTMLPIRLIAEALGAEVAWNAAEQMVTIEKAELIIEIYIDQPFATVNGEPVQLDASAFVENGRTYLPLRFIAENLGAEVVWDGQTQKVTVIG